ncbi:MAG: glycerophosphoryl diester phosphodiesterase [Porticoccaceae bacterium]
MHRLAYLIIIVSTLCAAAHGQEIVAHRGASFDAPENTLAAFRLAWQQKADVIEGDFYLTKDKQIVCIHDRTTKRVAPKQTELSVARSTHAELRTLDVGSWKHPRFAKERIPLLKEVLATVPEGKRIFVEIKCGPEIIPHLKTQLAASALTPEQIVIICFQKDVVTQSRRAMPQYKASWLTSYKQSSDKSRWKPTRDEVLLALKTTSATGLGTNSNLNVIDRAFVDAVREVGCEFHVWTVNDANSARTLQTLKVDSITTDRPAYIRDVLRLKTSTNSSSPKAQRN